MKLPTAILSTYAKAKSRAKKDAESKANQEKATEEASGSTSSKAAKAQEKDADAMQVTTICLSLHCVNIHGQWRTYDFFMGYAATIFPHVIR